MPILKSLISFTFLFILAVGCRKEKSTECIINKSVTDTSYGSIPVENDWDVYLPKDRSRPAKAVIILHGGSWTGGDKSEIDCRLISLLCNDLGLAVFNINYRLATSGSNQFPAQMEDIKQVIDSIVSGANKFNVQPDKFSLMGLSSGAHLALLYAYAYNGDKKVKAVIDLAGPNDLTHGTVWGNSIGGRVEIFLGDTYVDNPVLWQTASPYWQVNEQTGIPTLIFQGEKDAVVTAFQAYQLERKLKSLGIAHELVIYPEEGHGWTGKSYDHTLETIKRWLPRYLN